MDNRQEGPTPPEVATLGQLSERLRQLLGIEPEPLSRIDRLMTPFWWIDQMVIRLVRFLRSSTTPYSFAVLSVAVLLSVIMAICFLVL